MDTILCRHMIRPQSHTGNRRTIASLRPLTFTPVVCTQVVVRRVAFADFGVSLLEAIRQLPTLTDLMIDHTGPIIEERTAVSDPNDDDDGPRFIGFGLPHCHELADLCSGSLTRLRMFMTEGAPAGNTLRLIGLPELRWCELLGRANGAMNISINAASFAGAPRLQSLRLHFDAALRLQAGSLQQLTALTSLSLLECGLRSVPVEVASLSATLRVLDLSHNARLQLDVASVVTILRCGQLEKLGVYKPDIGVWNDMPPAVWPLLEQHMRQGAFYLPSPLCSQSVQNLLSLTDVFCAQHGHGLHVVVTECQDRKHLSVTSEKNARAAVWPLPDLAGKCTSTL